MEVTLDIIKTLRDETGVSVMQVKKALEESGGDMEKARMALRKYSSDVAAKKGERMLKAGIVTSYIHAGGTVGVLVELSCETDFVAKNEEFKALAHDIAMHIAAMNPKYRTETDIPAEEREKAKSFFADEVAKMDKPQAVRDKILDGKLDTYFKEQILLSQPFVKDQNVTIADLVKAAVQKFGENTEISRFARIAVGK